MGDGCIVAMNATNDQVIEISPPHPRVVGWLGASALAMGGSNQSLFIIGALFIGQGAIPGQGSAAVLLLIVGLILSYMAAPGWTELCCMFPNRVGGIAATCVEAFRPYSPILANLTGVCYWWGWVPTCGLTALLSASAIHDWILPSVPIPAMAIALVLFFASVNLLGVAWIVRLAIPIATTSATLAFLSAVIPVFSGHVDWHQAFSFHLTTPFEGIFGQITSAMAGLYLIGFAAPAFEAAFCHVGEMKNPAKDVPKAALVSSIMAGLYFLILPVIWLGCLGPEPLGKDLAQELGPTYAPLLGGMGRFAAMWFMMFNMFHGTMAPTAGVCRTLSQLADDGLLPRAFSKRNRFDAPYVATIFTAICAVIFLLIGDPIWLVAAANFTYLIGIALPNVAVWLLRKDRPEMHRPYKAPRGTIMLGLIAAIVWGISTIVGFQQFGLPTVIFGIGLAYSGSMMYAWRKWSDRRRAGLPGVAHSLHVKLTGAMMLVLVLDGAGYLLAVTSISTSEHPAFIAALEDIFVAVALLTISVGLVLPGMIAHSAVEVSKAANRLVKGTLADFTRAMEALAAGNLDAAHARIDIQPVWVNSRDEVGEMAVSFNVLQEEVKQAAMALGGAREGLREARRELTDINTHLEQRVADRTTELEAAHKTLVGFARQAGMAEVAIGVLHNVGNVLNSVNVSVSLASEKVRNSKVSGLVRATALLKENAGDLATYICNDEKGKQLPGYITKLAEHLTSEQQEILHELESLTQNVAHINQIVNMQQAYASVSGITEVVSPVEMVEDAIRMNQAALDRHSVQVQRRFEHTPPLLIDKHKTLQILVNLIANAKYALTANDRCKRVLTIRIAQGDAGRAVIAILDNGEGIAAENLARIFSHGFTTRAGGHGFGLHSSALAAREMGGSLAVRSEGLGRGAMFILELPLKKLECAA